MAKSKPKSKPTPQLGDMVVVEWMDAMGHSQWTSAKDFTLELGQCETIGRLVSRNRESIVVASNKCLANDTIDHVMAIPTKCIKSLTRLLPASATRSPA